LIFIEWRKIKKRLEGLGRYKEVALLREVLRKWMAESKEEGTKRASSGDPFVAS
jgi:hypothetical protein